MNELALRSITGVLLIGLAVAAVFVGGYSFAVFVAAAATAIFFEWTRIARGWGAGWYLGGFVYALAAAVSMLWIRDRADNGMALVMWLFIVVWSTDIGAYFVGRSIGGAKLAPAISPGKTWAGFYGGVVAATLLAGIWAWLTGVQWILLPLAPLMSVAAQGGDLFESWMKRRAGVKDSGAWLPGHGGIFDRLDGLLPVAILTAATVFSGVI